MLVIASYVAGNGGFAKTEPLYLCRPEPLRGVSLVELSLEEPALEAVSFAGLSLDESDLGLSSVLSLDPESPEDPGEVDFLA